MSMNGFKRFKKGDADVYNYNNLSFLRVSMSSWMIYMYTLSNGQNGSDWQKCIKFNAPFTFSRRIFRQVQSIYIYKGCHSSSKINLPSFAETNEQGQG